MTERARARRWDRPDASMSLLADLLAGKGLDPGYEEAAARRAAAGTPRDGAGRTGRAARLLAATVVLGLLGGVAAEQVRRGEPVAQRQRRALIGQIRQRQDDIAALERQEKRLKGQTEGLRRTALARGDAGRRARAGLARAAAAAAATPVHGPGMVVTVDDARAGRTGGDSAEGRIYDRDLQRLVNGLWAAGATAIGVNGQRVCATTAIRFAGNAILVDYRPLSRPYTVTALGDPGAVEDAFAGSPADRAFRTLKAAFGIRFDIRGEDDVRLPAAPAPDPRYAQEVAGK